MLLQRAVPEISGVLQSMRQALLQTGAEHQTILAAQIASLQASLNALAQGQISISLSGPLAGHFAPRVKAPPSLFPFLLFYFPSFHPPLLLPKTIRSSACLLLDCYLLGRSRCGPAFPLPRSEAPSSWCRPTGLHPIQCANGRRCVARVGGRHTGGAGRKEPGRDLGLSLAAVWQGPHGLVSAKGHPGRARWPPRRAG